MKMTLMALTIALFLSCGKKDDRSHSQPPTPSSPIQSSDKEEYKIENRIIHLASLGIHFARLSNVQHPSRPLSIYCSNTKTQNHEKIEELNALIEIVEAYKIENIIIDRNKIQTSNLLLLIQSAIKPLELEPYSSSCPQIYLAIQNL